MADTKISALTAVTSVADADTLAVVQGGVTKKATRAQLLTAGVRPFVEMDDSGFAWNNQGGASVASSYGITTLSVPHSGGDALRIRRKAAPVGDFSITAFLGSNTVYANYVYGGLLLGDSGGKWVSFGPGVFTAGGSHVVEWSSSSAAQTLRAQQVDYQVQKWYRIVVGATTITYHTSIDGFTWLQLASVGLTAYLADMTYIGYGYNSVNGSPGHLSVRSWEVG